jgi:hypothetical protein
MHHTPDASFPTPWLKPFFYEGKHIRAFYDGIEQYERSLVPRC